MQDGMRVGSIGRRAGDPGLARPAQPWPHPAYQGPPWQERLRRWLRTDGFPVYLIGPALLLEAVFVFVPLLLGFYYSLYDVRYFQSRGYVGLDNYAAILSSPAVHNSFLVTAIFSFASLIFTFAVGFGLALHLERDGRSSVLLRAVVLVPYVISMLVGSLLLRWILSQDSGVLQLAVGPWASMAPASSPARKAPWRRSSTRQECARQMSACPA